MLPFVVKSRCVGNYVVYVIYSSHQVGDIHAVTLVYSCYLYVKMKESNVKCLLELNCSMRMPVIVNCKQEAIGFELTFSKIV
jgi:hypothetical protein